MAEGRFQGTSTYVATDDLMMAVNAAVTLQRPILIKGRLRLTLEFQGPAQIAMGRRVFGIEANGFAEGLGRLGIPLVA